MTRKIKAETYGEHMQSQKPHTIVVSDLKRLVIQPDEALLIRFPREMSSESVKSAMRLVDDWQKQHSLTWPILFTRDDIEFLAIRNPERKLGMFDGDAEL